MSTKSVAPRTTYSVMNTARLMPSHVVETLGEFALLVSSSPCTIQGCRPISVSNQPAVAARYGSGIEAIAAQWNQRAAASFFFQYSQPPSAATKNMSTPAYAITRIDQ